MIKEILFGIAVGDALGVPVEFKSRQNLRQNPVANMVGYGTHNMPPGTFSDDSSMSFCLAEALIDGYDLRKIADNFIAWVYEGVWTPYGDVFDIGISTSKAIRRLKAGMSPELAGGFEVSDNGNGSLMRILPLLCYIKDKTLPERFQLIKEVSSITHAHIRSVIACFYYLEFARLINQGKDKFEVYSILKLEIEPFLNSLSINPSEISQFDRLIKGEIIEFPVDLIHSSGYVIDTLEASIYCLLTTETFKEALLKAVNLGEDTDTTGAVTGGLAGLLYGFENIPGEWVSDLARTNDIEDLADRLSIAI